MNALQSLATFFVKTPNKSLYSTAGACKNCSQITNLFHGLEPGKYQILTNDLKTLPRIEKLIGKPVANWDIKSFSDRDQKHECLDITKRWLTTYYNIFQQSYNIHDNTHSNKFDKYVVALKSRDEMINPTCGIGLVEWPGESTGILKFAKMQPNNTSEGFYLLLHRILSQATLRTIRSKKAILIAPIKLGLLSFDYKRFGFERCCTVDNTSLTPALVSKPEQQTPKPQVSLQSLFISNFFAAAEKKLLGLPVDLDRVFLPLAAAGHSELIKILGERNIKPERGVLLYGPPGTGKTSFARSIPIFLNIPENRVKCISATELIDSLIGNTEKRIRELFFSAILEKEMAEKEKRDPRSHVIIIDELDSLGRARAFSRNAWELTQVNQLLTCIDGLTQLPHIIVIGIVNDKNILDPALIRSGRLGTHIHFGLPDDSERKEIFTYYLKPLRNKGLLADDINLDELLEETKKFSGADIEAVINAASQRKLFDILNTGQTDDELRHNITLLHSNKIGRIAQDDLLMEIYKMRR